jgi:CheY-specific phosphatase CheX
MTPAAPHETNVMIDRASCDPAAPRSDGTREVLDQLLVRSALDALAATEQPFEDGGQTATAGARGDDDGTFVANIGFVGDELRGSIVLLTSARVVRAMQPDYVRPDVTTEAVVRDLLGELANLVLGRLKNNLVKRGVLVLVATPTTMSGRELEVSSPSAAPWSALTCPEGTIYARLDADFSGCPSLEEEPSPDAESPMDAGELTFL